MKWVVVAVILVFFLLLGVRLLRRLTLGNATIHITRITSTAEAAEVARALRRLQGVVEVQVDLEQHLAKVSYRRGKVTIEEIMTALHAAGY